MMAAMADLTEGELKKLVDIYQQIAFGYPEPEIIWANGQTIIDLAIKNGDKDVRDVDGNPLDPSQCYAITKKGIFLCVLDED